VGDAAAIVDPEDVKSMAAELETFASSASNRDRFRVAGLKRAGQFDWARTAERTLEVYKKALGAE
jgi:glycosyltransferase involved in cell wall biosynthesis